MTILVKSGRLWDGTRFSRADVLTEGDRVARIAPHIDCGADHIIDAAGMTVSPGLIDCHMHLRGISSDAYGIHPEIACFPFGVTAAADAGGEQGNRALLDFFRVKNVVFANTKIRDNHLDTAVTWERIALYGDKTIGIKLFFDSTSPHITDITPLREVCAFARGEGLKVMVHCNHSPSPMADIVRTLAPGDILSHVFHGGENPCTEDDFAAFRLAKEKGVVMDAAFAGHVHTDFTVLAAAISAGHLPDTISTDLTKASAFKRGGSYGQTMCMSMARTAGMDEADIFRAVTSAPAKALGMEDQWGILREGGCADIAVLSYTNAPFCLTGKAGDHLQDTQGYRCAFTISGGDIVYRHN